MRSLASRLAPALRRGDAVFLFGPLGAGKTTFVRGMLEGLGFAGEVRSPTFNLLQVFETDPPVLHVDLYRVDSPAGLGIEDYLDTHVCAIEWADRLGGFLGDSGAWRIEISFAKDGREVAICAPKFPE